MQDFRMETFLAVCRNLNYTKAAEELCITQPAVSQHIRHLEEYYGTRLFVSEGKKMVLTEAGKMLLCAGLTMQHDEQVLRERMRSSKTEGRSLKIGATRTIGEYVLPAMLDDFLGKNPETILQVTVGNTSRLLERIDRGELDFALVEGYFSRNDYDYQIYSTERYIAVAGNGYAFHQGKGKHAPERLEELLSEPLLTREEGSGSREILERVLEGKNLVLDDFVRLHVINNLQVIKHLVKKKKGITFLYEAAVSKELQEGSLYQIQLADCQVEHDFYFVWRKGSVFGAEYQEIFTRLKEYRDGE